MLPSAPITSQLGVMEPSGLYSWKTCPDSALTWVLTENSCDLSRVPTAPPIPMIAMMTPPTRPTANTITPAINSFLPPGLG